MAKVFLVTGNKIVKVQADQEAEAREFYKGKIILDADSIQELLIKLSNTNEKINPLIRG